MTLMMYRVLWFASLIVTVPMNVQADDFIKEVIGGAIGHIEGLLSGREACNQPQTVEVLVPGKGFVPVENGQRVIIKNAHQYGKENGRTVIPWRCAGTDEVSRCTGNTKTVVVERHSNTRWFPVGCSQQ